MHETQGEHTLPISRHETQRGHTFAFPTSKYETQREQRITLSISKYEAQGTHLRTPSTSKHKFHGGCKTSEENEPRLAVALARSGFSIQDVHNKETPEPARENAVSVRPVERGRTAHCNHKQYKLEKLHQRFLLGDVHLSSEDSASTCDGRRFGNDATSSSKCATTRGRYTNCAHDCSTIPVDHDEQHIYRDESGDSYRFHSGTANLRCTEPSGGRRVVYGQCHLHNFQNRHIGPYSLFLALDTLLATYLNQPLLFSTETHCAVKNAVHAMNLDMRSIRKGGLWRMAAEGRTVPEILDYSKHRTQHMLYRYLGAGQALVHLQEKMTAQQSTITHMTDTSLLSTLRPLYLYSQPTNHQPAAHFRYSQKVYRVVVSPNFAN